MQGVNEWFDEYMAKEELTPGQEPEMYKAMVLLLARCWEYKIKTEDVLELTQGNRKIALCTVVGLLEDGETYSTELRQRQKPGQGKMGQWEHELVCHKYEKPLLLQICRLLRGFTHPGTYFESSTEELALYSVEKFSQEMDTLLEITLRSTLVEKLSMALYDCLFEFDGLDLDGEDEGKNGELASTLDEYDHTAVASVHAFLQNLYFYASERTEEYRRHLLMETLLIPRLVLPYLDKCVIHATVLNTRAEAYSDMLEGDCVAEMALHNPQLVKGIAASLRTLVIASFRAPSTQFVMTLLRRLNPTFQMLRASAFCRYHDYIFALLCILNVNMGALDIGSGSKEDDDDSFAAVLLQQLGDIFLSMSPSKQADVSKRVLFSGAVPIARDTASYAALVSVLDGGIADQLKYAQGLGLSGGENGESGSKGEPPLSARGLGVNFSGTLSFKEENEHFQDSRAEAKKAHAERMLVLRQVDSERNKENMENLLQQEKNKTAVGSGDGPCEGSGAEPKQTAFQIAVKVANNHSDSKEAKGSSSSSQQQPVDQNTHHHHHQSGGDSKLEPIKEAQKFRLLGDLPSLHGGKDKAQKEKDVKIALSLELHTSNTANNADSKLSRGYNFMARAGGDSKGLSDNKQKADPSIPKEFLCSVNGHVMKDPIRDVSSGLVFERATIELWLQTRGSVCPITHNPLERNDLVPDDDLKNKIKRYQIQQTSLRSNATAEEDLYDF